MGFFDAFRRIMEAERSDRVDGADPRMAETGGVDDSAHPEYPDGRVVAADPAEMTAPPRTVDYDRDHWRKKLQRVLDRLPATQAEWPDMMAEANALGLETDWVERCQREEFALMIRRAVSDRNLTLEEHSKLELARILIGLPDAEAEAALQRVVAEAEAFFGASIQGAHRDEAGAAAEP